MAERLVGRTVSVTATSGPGDPVYTAPATVNAVVRVKIQATNVGATPRNLNIVHALGLAHPNQPGSRTNPSNYLMPLEGIPIDVLDVVLYGHPTTPDVLTAWISGGTVNLNVIAVEIT